MVAGLDTLVDVSGHVVEAVVAWFDHEGGERGTLHALGAVGAAEAFSLAVHEPALSAPVARGRGLARRVGCADRGRAPVARGGAVHRRELALLADGAGDTVLRVGPGPAVVASGRARRCRRARRTSVAGHRSVYRRVPALRAAGAGEAVGRVGPGPTDVASGRPRRCRRTRRTSVTCHRPGCRRVPALWTAGAVLRGLGTGVSTGGAAGADGRADARGGAPLAGDA
mmetsp:Transcript_30659/g.81546  ORF Transcript_30659/g.81546 Transcript_30659/m.81546 type:complete len:226 (-) Transcript_30659:855-1532(-)